MSTSPMVTRTPKHIAVKYIWFSQHIGKEFGIRKIELEHKRVDIFTKGLQ